MSHNTSRGDRTESGQNRKTGRSSSFNQQRQFSGGFKGGGGGGGGSSSATTANPSISNRSTKKSNSIQGGQSRVRGPNVIQDSSHSFPVPVVQNGAQRHQPTPGVSDALVTSKSANVTPIDTPAQRITQAVPRAPSTNASTAAPSTSTSTSSDTSSSATPGKAAVDASGSFSLQFGSISPGFMSGMQIPARTSSAPPNLDEQKKDQASHDSLKAAPAVPTPTIPKQRLLKKDTRVHDQPNTGEAQPVSQSKRDVQVSAAPFATQTQKPSVHPMSGMSMQMQFNQPQVPVQFGVPKLQIQSQATPTTSLPIPIQMGMSIPLPMGNPPMFVSGLRPPHMMQSQGLMHQGQNLNYSSQMGHQMPPQLGSIGINRAPQCPPQQAAKFTASRKTVKITHPVTHEELRLDGSVGPRFHPNVPPPSQPIPSFPPNQPMSYYATSYNSGSLYFPPPSSLPPNSAQILPSSQSPRFFNQVTVKPTSGSHVDKGTLPTSEKGESMKPLSPRGEVMCCQKDFDPSSSSYLKQSKPSVEPLSTSVSMASKQSATVRGSVTMETEGPKTLSSASLALVDDIASSPSSGAGDARNNTFDEPDSIMDEHKKPSNRGQRDQVCAQYPSASGLSSQLPEPETLEAKTSILSRTSVMSETTKESSLTTAATALEAYDSKIDRVDEGKTSQSSNILDTNNVKNRQSKTEILGIKGKEEVILPESFKPHNSSPETSSKSISPKSSEITCNHEESSSQEVVASSSHDSSLETSQQTLEECTSCYGDVSVADNLIASTSMLDGGSAIDASVRDDKTSTSDTSLSVPDTVKSKEASIMNSDIVDQDCYPVSIPSTSESVLKSENEGIENNSAKSTMARVRMKKKELYRKAEAAGTSSDLYMAYKGPEEKKETDAPAKSTENNLRNTTDETRDIAISSMKSGQSKVEPEDWEDAVDISSPKLTMKNEQQVNDHHGNGIMTIMYSRDFLLKFAEKCTELPKGFEIPSDMAGALMVSSFNTPHESYPSPLKKFDRPIGGFRPDHHGSVMADEDKRSKIPGPLMLGKGDMQMDIGYGGNVGYRPGQGGNYGVLWNFHVQSPIQHAGGILAGSMQSLGPQGGLQRNNSDSDRWQRGTAFQKGLIPSPQTPLRVMHKAEKKYEIGKVSDEEEIKQRQLKAILNKLTPQNFEKLFEQVKQVNIDNVVTLSGVISQIFDKALMEPTFCEMYANFCFHLAVELPDLSVENERITFKRLLLNKCQEEFERGEKEEEEANKADVEGQAKQSEEEREEKRLRARRRMLGNIRLIGELYKKRMLTERIMHECIKKLLGQYQNPDEEDVEALCKLMSTIGEMIDHPKAKEHMDAYFDIMARLSNNMKLSSRVRFMLKDSIDLRKNNWQQRRKVEGPKKIDEVHRDAAQERQAQASRLARASSIGTSGRRGPPLDFAPRAPNLSSSPSPQMVGFRAVPLQLRGHGSQDVRLEERHHFENRSMSVSLPQRPLSNDSITLGPQGGLARGMAFRGQPSARGLPLVEISSPGDARRIAPSLNGFSSVPERTAYGQREDLMTRYMPERFSSPSVHDQSNLQERSINHRNRDIRNADHNFDRSLPTSTQDRPLAFIQDASSENMLPEERLQHMSMSAIKEFYSARDENEVALCIKELNAPSFYPSMISLWVADSFERNDAERDLLTKLLIGLMKARDEMISQDQLIKGFESVLTALEDAVNDAPRAAEFLGRIFAKVIMEDVISFSEVGRLINEGGEEQGSLVEIGLAAEVLGSIFETIKSEMGDSVLTQIRSSSNMQLENFRPPGYKKSGRLDKFT
ncbi:eukaryotic translation initiation factor 4G [Olea europaea subsp. europaea]|uniref:Eukaryotic translation initiation factor 4G n=1 Tax=Olea europaea subsp. europaea TaxID=158383 RepID=A0A8S0PUL5_OLEEU|nr:eukaryotic translation initiation factor 4G [Olea europaea subsp. europaea]